MNTVAVHLEATQRSCVLTGLKVEHEMYEGRPGAGRLLWDKGLSDVGVSLLVSCSAEVFLCLQAGAPARNQWLHVRSGLHHPGYPVPGCPGL